MNRAILKKIKRISFVFVDAVSKAIFKAQLTFFAILLVYIATILTIIAVRLL